MSSAEDMIDGLMCSQCGICFEQEHGYPVLCVACYEESLKPMLRKMSRNKAEAKLLRDTGLQPPLYSEL